jgi:hypothetical protein
MPAASHILNLAPVHIGFFKPLKNKSRGIHFDANAECRWYVRTLGSEFL